MTVDLRCFLPKAALRPLMLLSARRPAEGGKRFPGITSAGDLSAHHFPTKSASPPAEGSLASPDAYPGIATWHVLRQPCVPARSSPALRLISPVTGSLSFLSRSLPKTKNKASSSATKNVIAIMQKWSRYLFICNFLSTSGP